MISKTKNSFEFLLPGIITCLMLWVSFEYSGAKWLSEPFKIIVSYLNCLVVS